MDLQLRGKTALITGGSTGIGASVARKLAAEGVDVFLCARDAEVVHETSRQIRSTFGVLADAEAGDLTRAEDVDRIARRALDALGGVDLLFNNAGQGTHETIMDAPDARWQYYWDLHVMAAIRMSRAVIPSMRERGGGAIINNASICALQPLYHEPIYNVTKSSLVMFTKCLAHEVVGDEIRVNAINPGLVQTAGWENAARSITAASGGDWEAYLSTVAEQYAPIKRFATPDELADFIVFLFSPRASYCVGSSYYVDGGWLGVTT